MAQVSLFKIFFAMSSFVALFIASCLASSPASGCSALDNVVDCQNGLLSRVAYDDGDQSLILLQRLAAPLANHQRTLRNFWDEAESLFESPGKILDAASVLLSSGTRETQADATPAVPSTMKIALEALPACALVAIVAVVVYWPQGPFVVSRIVAYIFVMTTMKLSVKFVFSRYGYNFPKFITTAHLMMSSVMGFGILLARYHLYNQEIPVPTWKELVGRIGPIAASVAFALAMFNSGLVYCSAAYAEIVSTTTPIVSIIVLFVMRIPFNTWLLLPTFVCMFGCMLSVGGQVNISIYGTALCLASNFGRAVKGVLQQDLMTGATREKFDPCSLLAWTCFCSGIIMMGWSVMEEGAEPLRALATSDVMMSTIVALLGSCVNACALNLLVLYVTKDLGAVGHLIVGQVATVLTLGGGVLLFGDILAPIQVLGFITTLGGAFCYSRWSKGEVKAAAPSTKAGGGSGLAEAEVAAASSK